MYLGTPGATGAAPCDSSNRTTVRVRYERKDATLYMIYCIYNAISVVL
jgi:hypothetical protein